MSPRYQVVAFASSEAAQAAANFYLPADEPVEGSGRFLLVVVADDGSVDRSLHPWAAEAHQIGQAAVILAGGSL